MEEASTHSSKEEQQAALPNAQNETQAEDAAVPPSPHNKVTNSGHGPSIKNRRLFKLSTFHRDQ